MAGDVLREFLVAIGFHADEASARKAEAAADRVEKTVTNADKRMTDAQNVGAAKRIVQTNREAGVRTKGAAALIAEFKQRREADDKHTNQIVAHSKDRERAEADAARAHKERTGSFVTGIVAMSAAATAAALTIGGAMVKIAGGLENAYYSSKRTKSSVANLQAFGYAASQLGSSAEEAVGFVEGLSHLMRSSPGYEGLLKSMGLNTRDAKGELKGQVQLAEELEGFFSKQLPHMQIAYAKALNLPDNLLHALTSGQMKKFQQERLDMMRQAGLDPDKAAKDSTAFMQVWRKMGAGLEIVATKIEGALVKRFGGTVDTFTTWLMNNSDRIATSIVSMGETVLRLVTRVGDLMTAFDKLSPGTKDFIIQIGMMGGALLLLKSGPLGVIIALSGAIVALYDDYRKWKEGSKDTLIDWDKWGPGVEKLLDFLKSDTGMIAAFTLLGSVLALKVVAPLASVLGLLTSINAVKMAPWLLGLLGVTGLAAVAHSEGILNAGEGSKSTKERIARFLDPGGADRAFGRTDQDKAADAKDNRTLLQRWLPKFMGGKDAPGDTRSLSERLLPKALGGKDVPESGTGVRQPEAEGTYRPVYKLSEADTSQRVLDTIASEARMKDPESVDAVINNMMNRLGTKGWGPSGNLHEVSQAPGQYEGAWNGRKATAKESEYLRERIKAIASGRVPDNTAGANSFRMESYYQGTKDKGPGYWAGSAKIGPNVGGNRYGTVPGIPNGPYAPYAKPKTSPPVAPAPVVDAPAAAAKAIPQIERGLQGFDDRFNDSWGAGNSSRPAEGRPLGTGTTSNSSVMNNIKIDSPTSVTVSGVGDAKAVGSEVGKTQSRVHADLLRNLQGAVA